MKGSRIAEASWKWEEKRTPDFVFFYEPGSYAARTVEEIAARAEAACRRGREWFGGDAQPSPITVYLAGWLEDAPGPDWIRVAGGLVAADRDLIWQVVSPEHPAVGLERLVLEVAARQGGAGAGARAGAAPPHVNPLLNALAELVVLELGGGSDAGDADRWAQEPDAPGRTPPALFAAAHPSAPAAAPSDVSFLLFLQRTFGRAALARFARALLTDEPDRAAAATYSRPLATLKADWLAALRAQRRTATTAQGILRRALPLLRPHWLRVAELLGYMLLDLLFALAIPLSSKYLFDQVIAPRDHTRLSGWLAVVLGIFAVGSAAGYRRVIVAGLIGERVLREMRRAGFAHLQRLSLRFYARSNTGDLLSRITHDMDSVQGALGGALPELLFQIVSLVVGAVVLLFLNWILGLIVLLLGIPLFAVLYIRAGERVRPVSRELQDRIGEMTGFVQEHLSAQMVVKSFSLQERAIALFEQHLARLFDSSMRIIGISGVLTGSTNMIYLGIRVIVLGLGAALIMRDMMSVGDLVAFVGLIGQVLSPVMAISGQYQQLQAVAGSFDRIQEIMAEVPDVADDPRAVALPDLQREIRLEHVTFRYSSGEIALRDVTLTVPAGKRVAVVGPSGAGKSTLVGLLLRLYDPDEGRVLFDGRDIRECTQSSLRRQIAIVPQDTYLFDASIGENIALGRETATEADVRRAAEAAAVHAVIERTESGYQTRVGERGARLSGGQRQRLAIARALIRDPRLLLLDEATSSLDPETESDILRTLEQVSRGRTMIMITHRLTSVTQCDTIFVLEQGRLVEQGTHAELRGAGGLYQRLYEEQTRPMIGGAIRRAAVEVERLRAIPLFTRLGEDALAALGERLVPEQYDAGTEVVRQGERGDRLYIIGRGQAEAVVSDSHGARRVNLLHEGDFFGEMALLTGEPRVATVRATAPTQLYSLAQADFVSLLEREPGVRRVVEQTAAERHAAFARAASAAAIDAGVPTA